MKTIEIRVFKTMHNYDINADVPGFHTAILDAYAAWNSYRPKSEYDHFLLCWKVVTRLLLLLDDVRHPMVTNKPPRPPYVPKYKGRRLD